MENSKVQWVLRIGVFGEFLGHGILALQGKAAWIDWVQQLLGVAPEMASNLVLLIGIMDCIVAFVVLLRPINMVLLWAVFWGFATALVRPIVGEPIWDFIERWANWAAPLALFMLRKRQSV